jgi:small subunit ribosomal protein S17
MSTSSFRHALNNNKNKMGGLLTRSSLVLNSLPPPFATATVTTTPRTITLTFASTSTIPSCRCSFCCSCHSTRFTSSVPVSSNVEIDHTANKNRTLPLTLASFRRRMTRQQRKLWDCSELLGLLSSSSAVGVYSRNFSTTGGGDDDDDGKDGDEKDGPNDDDKSTTPESSITSTTATAIADVPSTTPAATTTTVVAEDAYNPQSIMDSFQDTSYYYHPTDLNLIDRYSNMTNDELIDNTTIPGWDYLIHSPPLMGINQLPKGALVGRVVSTKMHKTVNVAVDRYRVHPKYRKRIKFTRKFMAHDEGEVAKDGDTVLIVPCQRISKMKHFMLREIVRPKGQL